MSTTTHTPEHTRSAATPSRVDRIAVPLMFGAGVATWIAITAFQNPGAGYEPNPPGMFLAVLLITAAGFFAHRSNLMPQGPATSVGAVGLLAFALLLHSVALGLVAGGFTWMVWLLVAVGFIVTAGSVAAVARTADH